MFNMSSGANVYTGPEQFNSDIRDLRGFAPFSQEWHEEFTKISKKIPFPKRHYGAAGHDRIESMDDRTNSLETHNGLHLHAENTPHGSSCSTQNIALARTEMVKPIQESCDQCHKIFAQPQHRTTCYSCTTSHALEEARNPTQYGDIWLHEGTSPPLFRYKEEYMARVSVLEQKLSEQSDALQQSRSQVANLKVKVQQLSQACERGGNNSSPMSYKRRAVAMFDDENSGRHVDSALHTGDGVRAIPEEPSDDGNGAVDHGYHGNEGCGEDGKRVSTRRRTPSLQLVESMSLQLAQAEKAQLAQRAHQLLARPQNATESIACTSPKDNTKVGGTEVADHSSPVFRSYLHYGRDKSRKRPMATTTSAKAEPPIVID
eukprot:m.600671 g.600671  ORF g.600671 m.600671 type:complete len:374 (-) comp22434_c0_seq12:3159-4280(-)